MIIPINEKPYYNCDSIANSIAADDMFDCYLEPVPGIGFATRRRPGLTEWISLGVQAGDGLFYWDALQCVIAVNSGRVYQIFENGIPHDITGSTLAFGTPVTFADGTDLAGTPWLYMANGKMVYSINGANTVEPTDPNAPDATHVAYIKSAFLANEPGTNRFLFTDTNPNTLVLDNTYWSSPDNPLTCEAKGDTLLAMVAAWQEIYAWGTQGLEVWQNDGITPFAPISGAFSEGGITAPYSVVVADNTLFGLCVIGGSRVVIKMNGRAPAVISEPIARVLADMDDVSDAIGDLVSVGGMAIYLLSFPTANQTWAYDYKNDTWSRWGKWDESTGSHDRFLGQHSCFAKAWNKHLIMSREDGKIYEMRRDVYDDDGLEMVSFRRTGWIDHNTFNRKICDQFYVKCKAGESDIATLLVRWRADGGEEWSKYMELLLSPVGDRDFLSKNNRFGMYRTRQYEFRISDNADLVLVRVDAEIRGLSS
jgi:hypothetical protein